MNRLNFANWATLVTRILIAGLGTIAVTASQATIVDTKQLQIDFTRLADAANKATWSEPEHLTVSEEGLGWDGETAALRDGWIQTKPLALGLSWRPPFALSVRVTIEPKPREFTLKNGQTTTPYEGDVYLRYSPDRVHWSNWEALNHAAGPQTDRDASGRTYTATVRVPYRVRDEYSHRLSDFSKLDVPWKSDEEAAVRWILDTEPDFFARQIPFIGYVEFLYEGSFHGGQRVRSFNAQVSYGMSGLHAAPRDETVYKDRDSTPWRFQAKAGAESTWVERCLQDFASIQAGMTRHEVAQRFPMDGGLQGASPVRFVHPKCSSFKVDVEFGFKRDATDQNRAVIGEDDRVVRVSKPYLERSVSD